MPGFRVVTLGRMISDSILDLKILVAELVGEIQDDLYMFCSSWVDISCTVSSLLSPTRFIHTLAHGCSVFRDE